MNDPITPQHIIDFAMVALEFLAWAVSGGAFVLAMRRSSAGALVVSVLSFLLAIWAGQ